MPNAEGRMEERPTPRPAWGPHLAWQHMSRAELIAELEQRMREAAEASFADDALAAARAEIEAVEAACFAVCRDNTREALGDDVDPEDARFVCLNENGDPIIEADTPADVVRQMNSCWAAMGERFDRLSADYAAARAENERMRAAMDDVVRLFRHYETVPCLSALIGEDVEFMAPCECAGCMARKWMAQHGRALAAQEGTR